MAFNILDTLNSMGAGQSIQGLGTYDRSFETSAKAAPPKQNFAANVAHSIGHFASATANAVGHQVVDPFQHLIQGTAHNIQLHSLNVGGRLAAQQGKQKALDDAYASKKISRQQYVDGLKGLNSEGLKLSADAHKVATTRYDAKHVAGDYAQAAGTVATLAAPALEAGAGALAGVKGAQAAAKVADAGLATGKFMGTQNKGIISAAASVPGKLARNALVTQPVLQAPGQIASDIKQGKYGSAALEAGAFAAPGIVKGIKKLAEFTPALHDAVFGKQGFFGAVHAAGGPDMLSHLKSLDGTDAKKAEGVLRQLQQMNLDETGGNVKVAGQRWVQNMKDDGLDPSTMNPQDVLNHASQWIKAETAATKAGAEGRVVDAQGAVRTLNPGERYVASRANPTEIKTLRTRLAGATTVQERHAIVDDMAKNGASFGKNPNVLSRIHSAVEGENWKQQLAAKNLPALHPYNIVPKAPLTGKAAKVAAIVDKNAPATTEKTAGQKVLDATFSEPTAPGRNVKLPQGYGVAVTKTGAAIKPVAETAALEYGTKGRPVLGAVGRGLVKAGLSPEATNNSSIRGALQASLARELKDRNVPGDARGILAQLNSVDKTGAIDVRNLSKTDIQGALGAGYAQHAGNIQQALKAAYAGLPRELVGLGPSVLNKAIKNVPGLAGYLRIQSVGRYEVNPFFRLKQYIKSGLVAGAEGARVGVKATNDDINALQEAGLLTRRGGAAGGDATLAGNLGGESGKKLYDKPMRLIISKTAASIAQAHGMTVREALSMNTPLAREMKQSLSLVTSYGKGGYLNSPFAKTLNLVIFPSRFETKVAMEAAKVFAKASPLTQVAAAGSLAHAASFLGSPQGKQWQKDNSELLGIIKAFTPLQTIDNISKFFTQGYHVGDLGELGGLPIGVISQILEHQGVNLGKAGSSQYMDPKTGQPVPEKIPQTTKARFQQGFTDLIGSMYSYPGKNAGLGSKTNVTQAVVPGLKPNPKEVKSEFKNGQEAPSIKKPTAATPAAAKTYKPTPGSIPTIKTSPVAPIAPKKKKGARPKIYAKKYGQPL